MVIHCCIWFEQKVSYEGLGFFWGGGLKVSCNIYISIINDNTEFDGKILYIMFLHDYYLACEIYMVGTIGLRFKEKNMVKFA